jgi:hypothetical protein
MKLNFFFIMRDKILKLIDENRGAIIRYCEGDLIDAIIQLKWEWVDIKLGVPEKSDELKQYLCDDSGIYSVCTVEFDEEEDRNYFRDDNYLEVHPDRYKLINF